MHDEPPCGKDSNKGITPTFTHSSQIFAPNPYDSKDVFIFSLAPLCDQQSGKNELAHFDALVSNSTARCAAAPQLTLTRGQQ